MDNSQGRHRYGTILGYDIPGVVSKNCPMFFSDLSGNSHLQKPNKAQKKRANITGVQYFCGLWYNTGTNRSGVNFV